MNLIKGSIVLALIYVVYVWTSRTNLYTRENNYYHSFSISTIKTAKEFNADEQRIARHFVADTLPGLMQRGLVKKYEQHQSGNILFVAGGLWKKRSKYFKESLLLEIMVYNKVHGNAIITRIVDCNSQQLYAQVVSEDRKELYD